MPEQDVKTYYRNGKLVRGYRRRGKIAADAPMARTFITSLAAELKKRGINASEVTRKGGYASGATASSQAALIAALTAAGLKIVKRDNGFGAAVDAQGREVVKIAPIGYKPGSGRRRGQPATAKTAQVPNRDVDKGAGAEGLPVPTGGDYRNGVWYTADGKIYGYAESEDSPIRRQRRVRRRTNSART